MKLLNLLFLCCIALTMNAQQPDSLKIKERKNNISLNIGGETMGATINYQRYIINKKNIHVSIEAGVGCTIISFGKLSIPTLLGLEIGKKHRLCAEFGASHLINFSPYPATKAERAAYRLNPDLPQYTERYEESYNYTLVSNFGYKYVGKKGFNAKLVGGIFYFKQSPYNRAVITFMPKLSVGYAF
jgi:hypothetical protein